MNIFVLKLELKKQMMNRIKSRYGFRERSLHNIGFITSLLLIFIFTSGTSVLAKNKDGQETVLRHTLKNGLKVVIV
ncbi:MAG TPA: hypothetical protein VKA34_19590, partial [Balneolales bacterium]|nr:hypothetical protein [Balneolales bacterium]